MSSYAFGDIQGCFAEFTALLSLIEFNPNIDKVYLVGDLVNRGPDSLEMLRFAYNNQESIKLVLGNHDLHLLACWAGFSKPKALDTLTLTLMATDISILMNWLRMQPLMLELPKHVIVHAGINPTIEYDSLVELAVFCSDKLSSDNYLFWLSNMYGNTPAVWSESLSDVEKFRFGINSFTRMRMLNDAGLELKFKSGVENAPSNLSPWYVLPAKNTKQVIFGHWSALGLLVTQSIVALDTGCIWGGQLTAYCLDDGALYQYPALNSSNVIGE